MPSCRLAYETFYSWALESITKYNLPDFPLFQVHQIDLEYQVVPEHIHKKMINMKATNQISSCRVIMQLLHNYNLL